MSAYRSIRILRVLFVLAIIAVGFIAAEGLTSGITPTTAAVCLHGTCTQSDPPVTCSNGASYANICVANAACQYSCCPGPNCGSGGGGPLPPIVIAD
jgi:hypothetical protein